jgi:hypothetical protein
VVAAFLRREPGKWAKIHTSPGLEFMPWWGPLYESDEFEVKFVSLEPGKLFGGSDIYARFKS